jgi:SAM-dependent methyltransferase
VSSLHELRPTTRFSDRAGDYVKFRPSYPSAAIDAVLAGLGEPSSLRAADVGAGTGISARLLAERGVRVIAIEPNAAMREAAEPHALVEWREGKAEATGLRDASVELVLCAQAFHWFEHAAALREFRRVLKPRGRLALMWNARDVRDPFTASYVDAILAVGGESAVERASFDADVVSRSALFTAPVASEIANEQRLDLEGVLGRARSASYVPKDGASGERLVELLTTLHARHRDAAGLVALRYVTRVYVSERVP